MPEAVLCSAKSDSQLRVIVDELASTGHPTLLTRLPAERLGCLSPDVVEQIDHDPISETGILGGMQSSRPGTVAIAAAGPAPPAEGGEDLAGLGPRAAHLLPNP